MHTQVERQEAPKEKEKKFEFAKATKLKPFTVKDFINGTVLAQEQGHIFPLSNFRYGSHSLPPPFSQKLRISVNHARPTNTDSNPRRLKNVHVLLHYTGLTADEMREGDRSTAKPSTHGWAGPQDSFVAIICLLEAEQLRRVLLLDDPSTRSLASKVSLCTVDGTWLVRSSAISNTRGWQLTPSVARFDEGGATVDHEHDIFTCAQGAKFFNSRRWFRHFELPALLNCFDVDAVPKRNEFGDRQAHAVKGNPDFVSPPPESGLAMRRVELRKARDEAYGTEAGSTTMVRKQVRRWFFEEMIFARRRENRNFALEPVRKALENDDARVLQEAHALMQLIQNAIKTQFGDAAVRGTLNARTPLEAAFLSYDEDGNGLLTTTEIKAMLDGLRIEDVTQGKIDTLISIADTDGDRELSYGEFAQLFSSDETDDLLDVSETSGKELVASRQRQPRRRMQPRHAALPPSLSSVTSHDDQEARVEYSRLSQKQAEFGGMPAHLVVGRQERSVSGESLAHLTHHTPALSPVTHASHRGPACARPSCHRAL